MSIEITDDAEWEAALNAAYEFDKSTGANTSLLIEEDALESEVSFG